MERYHTVRDLLKDGLTYKEIGKIIGVSGSMIEQMAMRMGLSRRMARR